MLLLRKSRMPLIVALVVVSVFVIGYVFIPAFADAIRGGKGKGGGGSVSMPIILTTGAITDTTVELSWTDVTDRETGYEIEQSISSGTGYEVVGTTNLNTTTYTARNLGANTTYYFRVRYFRQKRKSTDYSEYSNIAVAQTLFIDNEPPTISDIQAPSITDTSAMITWVTNEAADSLVLYSHQPDLLATSTTIVDAVDEESHSILVTGLNSETQYYYVVKSTDPHGNVAASELYSFTTLAPAESGGQSCVDSDGGVNYAMQGTLTFPGGVQYSDMTDFCAVLTTQHMHLLSQTFDHGYNVVESCEGENCRLIEKSCPVDGGPAGNSAESTSIANLDYYGCPNGCSSGACLPGPNACLEECPYSGAQLCAGSDQMMVCGNYDSDPCLEWSFSSCENGNVCDPPGELGGSCTQLSCTDSDGGANYSEKGTVTLAGSSPSVGDTDSCIKYYNSTGGYFHVQSCVGTGCALLEKSCSADLQSRTTEAVGCSLGCSDGACATE
jgi:hypothetical protein